MDADRYRQIEDLFHAALGHAPEARGAFLDEAAADPALRAAVERLLDADTDGEGVLDGPALVPSLAGDRLGGDAPPRVVGPYRVLRPLGRGGMGEVLLAVREVPYRRYVALKVLRDGGRSPEARARFAVERQVLASLDHVGIARLYDGGVTDEGVPYLAMEVVDGRPITDYSDERRLGVEDRLRLFARVCEAVHYAHQNLVLHRDLKPSNVLVTASGEVKLLDFGIAKLLDPGASAVPVPETQTGARLLTPEYASPEQVRGEGLSTASDVYSLGVVLYELLTGRRPHDLAGRTTDEVIRTVSETPPTNPSTVVTRDPGRVRPPEADPPPVPSEVAARRGLTPDRLARRLAGDLDAICLRSLRKEPGRRYGSAELLAQDIERHLARRPVLARRGTRRYRTVAFLRRHRLGVALTAATTGALAVGLGLALWQARVAAAERDRAEESSAFMVELLGDFNLNRAEGGRFEATDVLDRAVIRIDGLDAQPDVKARLLTHIGTLYSTAAHYPDAERLFRRGLALRRALYGDVHPDVAESLNYVAWARFTQGAHREADSLYTLALAVQDRLPEQVMVTRTATLNELALVRRALGDPEAALALAREAYSVREAALGPDDPVVTTALGDLAAMHQSVGQHGEAVRLFERVVAQRLRRGETVEAAQALSEYGGALTAQGDIEGASRAHERAVAIRRRILGDAHPKVAESLGHLGWALQTQGRYAEAEPLYREALAIQQDHFGPADQTVGFSLLMLGEVRTRQGDAGGLGLTADAVETFRDVLGADHPTTLAVALRHARNLAEAGRPGEARALAQQTLARYRDTLGADHAKARETEAFLTELNR